MKGKSLEELLQSSPQKHDTTQGEDLGTCASHSEPNGRQSLYVLNGKEDTRAFQYVHLGYASYAADGTSFVIEFNEPEKWRLAVKGRKLWKIFVGIHQHALEWIKKTDRDFGDGNAPVITDIRIDRVKEDDKHPDE